MTALMDAIHELRLVGSPGIGAHEVVDVVGVLAYQDAPLAFEHLAENDARGLRCRGRRMVAELLAALGCHVDDLVIGELVGVQSRGYVAFHSS